MRNIALFKLAILLYGIAVFAGEPSSDGNLPGGIKGLSVGGLCYLHYQAGEIGADSLSEIPAVSYNEFKVSRAYLTVEKEIRSCFGSRITLDVTQDNDGDIKVRAKYAYAHFKFPGRYLQYITGLNLEFGLVHMPWLDFEEHINYYRMQGHMFMEESHLFNSADFGFTIGGYFGGEMDENFKKTVNKKYPGRYGSFAVGAYNGGGYHAPEKNENKTIDSRVTVRPLPDILPGMQISYFGIFGKGNQAPDADNEIPDWSLAALMLSCEHRYLTLTGQIVTGEGNQKGTYVETTVNAADSTVNTATSTKIQGFSVFGEGKIGTHWRIIGRFDSFDEDTGADNDELTRIIAGLGYDFGNHNVLLFDYQVVDYAKSGAGDDYRYQLTMQIHY